MVPVMNRPQPKVERAGAVTVVTFTAGAIRDVENVIARELEGHTDGAAGRHLLLDFTNVRYLNSMELGTLISLHKKAEAAGGRSRRGSPPPRFRRRRTPAGRPGR